MPQQVCVPCAKNAIAACLFKKKCEDADNFFRQQLLMQKIDNKLHNGNKIGGLSSLDFENNVVVLSETEDNLPEELKALHKQNQMLSNDKSNNGYMKMKSRDEPMEMNGNGNQNGDLTRMGNGKVMQSQDPNEIPSLNLSESDDDEDEQKEENREMQNKINMVKEQNDHNDNEMKLENGEEQVMKGLNQTLNMANLVHMDENELKNLSAKAAAFDLNSLHLMQQYMMQHQFNRLNGPGQGPQQPLLNSNPHHLTNGGAGVAGGDDEIHSLGDSDERHSLINSNLNSINLNHHQHHQSHHMQNHDENEQQDHDEDGDPLPLIPEIELITPSEEMNANQLNGLNGGTLHNSQLRGYQCPTCYQIFELKQILKAHMQSVHGTAGPVYECTNCKKTYFYKRFLEKHVRRGRCVKKRRNQT